jgi:hypothetical protein
LRVVSVVGARPQFVKLAPVAAALTDVGADHKIVHTGQHYDARMSSVFFSDLGIPEADVHMGIGSDSHGVQTGKILAELDGVLVDLSPDCVLVYGDTNSTCRFRWRTSKQDYDPVIGKCQKSIIACSPITPQIFAWLRRMSPSEISCEKASLAALDSLGT